MDVWILFVVAMAVVPEFAAAARDLSASPMASPGVTTTGGVQGQDAILLKWLQITAVPLGVALMGACVWKCIENSVAWRSLTGQRGHMPSNATDEGVDLRPAHELSNIDSSRDGSDMEEGNALSYSRVANNGPANSVKALVSVQQPAIESPDDAGSDAATHVAP